MLKVWLIGGADGKAKRLHASIVDLALGSYSPSGNRLSSERLFRQVRIDAGTTGGAAGRADRYFREPVKRLFKPAKSCEVEHPDAFGELMHRRSEGVISFSCRVFYLILLYLIFPLKLYAQDWHLAGTRGIMNFVVVSKEREADKDVYLEAIQSICKVGENCKIIFWASADHVPTSWPMTDAQRESRVVDYFKEGNSEEEKFLWNCRIVNDPSQCF